MLNREMFRGYHSSSVLQADNYVSEELAVMRQMTPKERINRILHMPIGIMGRNIDFLGTPNFLLRTGNGIA
jgi:hypothetical protein